jgi:hypothetical protein
MTLLAVIMIAVFLAVAAAFHIYWGCGGQYGHRLSVPQRIDGTPLFTPTPAMTHAVGVALLLMLVVLVAFGLRLDQLVPRWVLRLAIAGQGAAFLVRGLSWHPYIGLFKTVRTTEFARMDTLYYSPCCIAAGLGFLLLAWQG